VLGVLRAIHTEPRGSQMLVPRTALLSPPAALLNLRSMMRQDAAEGLSFSNIRSGDAFRAELHCNRGEGRTSGARYSRHAPDWVLQSTADLTQASRAEGRACPLSCPPFGAAWDETGGGCMSNTLLGRRSILPLAAVALLVRPRWSEAQDASQVGAAIQRLYAALLAAMKAGARTPFMQRYNALVGPVTQALDLPYILQTAVGPAWSALPAAQKSSLENAFQNYTVATYVSQFDSYAGEQFQVLPGLRALPNGSQVLQTRIIGSGGTPHEIDYVMRQAGSAWKAIDVLLDGSISRVAVLRSDFRRLFSRGGPTELANYLQQKATALSGATSPP